MFHFTALALPFFALIGFMGISGFMVLAYPKPKPMCDNRRLTNRGLW